VGDQRLGATEPRLFTQPLRPLTPETSLGFEFIEFAQEVVGIELLPWQRWWAIHAFELNEDGRFRFRTVMTLVARQNGKTILMKLVALWKMYLGHAREVLGVAQTRDVAKDTWQECIDMADEVEDLAAELSGKPRQANGQEVFQLLNGARYRIAAANRKGGRSKSIDLLMIDEVREWLDKAGQEAWGAISKTTMARRNSQTMVFSNAGDKRSLVLKTLRASGINKRAITSGLFEWSAPDGCKLDDRDGWAQANPSLGYSDETVSEESIQASLDTDPAPVFRTEVLCQEVDSLTEALDLASWNSMADPAYIIQALESPRVVLGVETSIDGLHTSLIAVAESPDGLYYVEPVDGWDDTTLAAVQLREWVKKILPAAIAWLPGGPSGPIAADVRKLSDIRYPHTTDTVKVVDVSGVGVKEACQGLADLVSARKVAHPGDPMLDSHVTGASRYDVGDGWRFARKGSAPIDGIYATAAAIHVLRSLPKEDRKRSFVY
jgi:hypothetical protein